MSVIADKDWATWCARFDFALTEIGVEDADLAALLRVPEEEVTLVRAGKETFSPKVDQASILIRGCRYAAVSITWLIDGKGEMRKAQSWPKRTGAPKITIEELPDGRTRYMARIPNAVDHVESAIFPARPAAEARS